MPGRAGDMDEVSAAVDGRIVVEGVGRSFGPTQAVIDASFEALPGRITGLIGPNGSGKTTLLLMLATLLRPDRGTVRVAGFDPALHPQQVRARIGWMPDVLGSWGSLSVRTTLQLVGRMYGMDKAEAADRAAELITLAELVPLADQPTRVLSRGQKQRLSLARALVHDPQVLLLDEPASGLDPAARVHLRELLLHLARDGKTVLVSSHVLAELDEMADDAVYLDAGRTASAEAIARASTSMRAWRVRSLDVAALLAALGTLGVTQERVRPEASGALVTVAGEQDAAVLLAALVSQGIPVTAFAPAVGDLEHTFLDLSQGGGS